MMNTDYPLDALTLVLARTRVYANPYLVTVKRPLLGSMYRVLCLCCTVDFEQSFLECRRHLSQPVPVTTLTRIRIICKYLYSKDRHFLILERGNYVQYGTLQ